MNSSDTIIDLKDRRVGRADRDRDGLLAYWREIGGGSDVPRRDDIDPARIAPCLSRIIVLERIAPRQARIRLAGQEVGQGFGIESRGMPLSSLITPASREWLGESIEALFDDPARIDLGLSGPRTTFRKRLTGSMLLLPLRDREDAITRALGYIELPERRTTAPIRFEISGEKRESILTRATRAPMDEPELPDFEAVDRARDAARRRAAFHVVTAD
ncbi:PAS domain-containing protein [Palleronia sp.]|uniref:PAS domain-containing protein n=1 Tax=Palleronia sp. TaxID=1940284 RepID=UPI0035C7CDB3